MAILSAMYLNHFTNSLITTVKTFLFKTVIFIAVLISCSMASAQEYNNWLMCGGAVLNFDTSPATIICGDIEKNSGRFTVMLSDDTGQIMLYGYKTSNGNESLTDFVIKNKENQTLVSFPCVEVKNVIGCKLTGGGYYIAAVLRPYMSGELHVYKFNKNGQLEDEFVYNDGYYTFFLDFINLDDEYVSLVSYKIGQTETYRLTSYGCTLWATTEVILDNFSMFDDVFYDIEHTLDGSTIIASGWGNAYVFNFNKHNGEISVVGKFDSNNFRTMSFSKIDKYFLVVDGCQLKGYLYDNAFDFNLDNPDIIYDLPCENEIVCNHCWDMAVGVDGKLYICKYSSDWILVIDGIEEGLITEEIIKSDCMIMSNFPRIPRMADYHPSCRASAAFDNAIACNGQPLNILTSGDAPFEIFYTIDGEERSIKTSEPSYQLPNIAGKYQITKIIDASCESVPAVNNAAEILPKMKTLIIVEED